MDESKPIDKLLHEMQCIAYVQVAVTIAVFYDHFTTFDLEVELIWKKKWTFVTVLFIINRYFGEALPLYLTSDLILGPSSAEKNGECSPAPKIEGWASHVIIWSMQAIMQYRIFTMYKQSKRVIFLAAVAFATEILSMVVIDLLYLHRINVNTEPHPGIHVCVSHNTNWFYISWIPIFGYESIILLLGLRAGMQFFKESRSLPSSNRFPLHFILLRDSILYPVIALIVGASNVLGWFRPLSYSTPVAAGLSQFFSRMLGCRLILNLREAYYLPFEEECSRNEGLQSLVFAQTDGGAESTIE